MNMVVKSVAYRDGKSLGEVTIDDISEVLKEPDTFVCPACGHKLEIFTDDVEAPRYRLISAPVRKPKTPTD